MKVYVCENSEGLIFEYSKKPNNGLFFLGTSEKQIEPVKKEVVVNEPGIKNSYNDGKNCCLTNMIPVNAYDVFIGYKVKE